MWAPAIADSAHGVRSGLFISLGLVQPSHNPQAILYQSASHEGSGRGRGFPFLGPSLNPCQLSRHLAVGGMKAPSFPVLTSPRTFVPCVPCPHTMRMEPHWLLPLRLVLGPRFPRPGYGPP